MTKRADSTRHPTDLPYAGFGWKSALPLLITALPEALILPTEREALHSFALSLPGTWHWGMFETRLGEKSAPVDVLAAMAQLPETRKALTTLLSEGGHPLLNPARGALHAWAQDTGSPYAESPNLWLEWDRDRQNAPPLPWLCIAPDFFDRTREPLNAEQIADLATEFMQSDPELFVDGAAECLARLAESLPSGGKLMGFSSLKPRGKSICRVFAKLPPGQTAPWLERIGWTGDRVQLQDALPMFSVPGEDEWCQIEFAEDVGPYLALELAQTERGFPRRDARERWLTEVAKRGWATPEKASSVLDWHGQTECTLPGAEPVRLLRSFHLKVAFAPGSAPLAKAYLGFYFRKKRRALAA